MGAIAYQNSIFFFLFIFLLQLSENLEIVQNGQEARVSRSEKSDMDFLDHLTNYIKSHDVIASLPGDYFKGTTLTMSPRNLDNDELTLSLKFSEDSREGKAIQAEEGNFLGNRFSFRENEFDESTVSV